MAIVVEDGSLVDGANSFISVAELDSYLTDRGYTVTGDKEPLLIRAYDLMIMLPWCEDINIEFTVTDEMKKAQSEISYQIGNGFDPSAIVDRRVKRQEVDVLEVEYMGSARGGTFDPITAIKRLPTAYGLICDQLCMGQGYLLRA